MRRLFSVLTISLLSFSISVFAQTSGTLTATASKVCKGEVVRITASGCSGLVYWASGAIGISLTDTLNKTTTYQAACMQGEKVLFAYNALTVEALDVPLTPYMMCTGEEINLGESAVVSVFGCVGTVVWNNGMKGAAITVTPKETSTYTAVCQNAAGCGSTPISRTIIVYDKSKPVTAPVITQRYGCKGEPVLMKASGCTAGVYVWYKNTLSANGDVIRSEELAKGNSVEVSEGGTSIYYTAKCLFQACLGDESNRIELAYITDIAAPTVKKLYIDSSDSTATVDLSTALDSKPVTSGGLFEYHTGNTVGSALVASSAKVKSAGEYYVFEKSREGNCVSAASKIIVEAKKAGQEVVTPTTPLVVLPTTPAATTPVATPQIPLTIQATDKGAVIASQEPNSDMADIIIPEGFSPNNDGVNDKFEIKNLGDKKATIRVYNRWGHMVYSADEYKNDWDGSTTQKSALGLPDGIYYYMLKLSDGRQKISFLTLAR